MNENPYMKLVKFILPSEMNEYFDLVDVALDQYDDEQRLHLYLDEKDIKPENQPESSGRVERGSFTLTLSQNRA